MISWLKRIWRTPPPQQAPQAPAEGERTVKPEEVWIVLNNVNEWVKHAETKLGVVLAFLGVLAAGLITLVLEAGRPSWLMAGLAGVTALLLILAIGSATLGLLPQFAHVADERKANAVYYGDIHRFFSKREDFAEHLAATLSDEERVLKALSQQIIANSGVAVRKFTWANRAIFLGMLSVLGSVAFVTGLVLCW